MIIIFSALLSIFDSLIFTHFIAFAVVMGCFAFVFSFFCGGTSK